MEWDIGRRDLEREKKIQALELERLLCDLVLKAHRFSDTKEEKVVRDLWTRVCSKNSEDS